MQTASDIFLGWTEDVASHRYFYVRHLKNRRLGSIGELVEQEALASYARLCGRTLARAHARSADPLARTMDPISAGRRHPMQVIRHVSGTSTVRLT
jgi:hypothetical protein